MTKLLARFAKNESGATAIEYGLIAALIAVVAIAGMNLVGSALVGILTRISTELRAAS